MSDVVCKNCGETKHGAYWFDASCSLLLQELQIDGKFCSGYCLDLFEHALTKKGKRLSEKR